MDLTMLFWKKKKNQWVTVAVDQSHGMVTTFLNQDRTQEMRHTIEWQVCVLTGERRGLIVDTNSKSLEFAKNKHDDIAAAMAVWKAGGIPKMDKNRVVWIDKNYAPKNGIDAIIDNMKSDKELGLLIAQYPAVAEAVNELEIAVKMCK